MINNNCLKIIGIGGVGFQAIKYSGSDIKDCLLISQGAMEFGIPSDLSYINLDYKKDDADLLYVKFPDFLKDGILFIAFSSGNKSSLAITWTIINGIRYHNSKIILFAISPFLWEGRDRWDESKKFLEEVLRQSIILLEFPNEKMFHSVSKNISATAAYLIAFNEFSVIVRKISQSDNKDIGCIKQLIEEYFQNLITVVH